MKDNNKTNQPLTCKSCDRFNKCSANICPIDADWKKRKHLAGERVCFYMTEAEKIDAEAVFRDSGSMQLYITIKEVALEIARVIPPEKDCLYQ